LGVSTSINKKRRGGFRRKKKNNFLIVSRAGSSEKWRADDFFGKRGRKRLLGHGGLFRGE